MLPSGPQSTILSLNDFLLILYLQNLIFLPSVPFLPLIPHSAVSGFCLFLYFVKVSLSFVAVSQNLVVPATFSVAFKFNEYAVNLIGIMFNLMLSLYI